MGAKSICAKCVVSVRLIICLWIISLSFYESEKYVHLVIVGMSRMGVALAVEAAHIAHYPNFIRDKRRKRASLLSIIKQCVR